MEKSEIERAILKNKFVESFNFIILLLLLVVVSLIFVINSFIYQVAAMGIFFCGVGLLIVFGPEMNSIKFSDVLSYYIEQLSGKIKNHSKEESTAKEGLITIRTANRLIEDYIQEGKSKTYLVFGFDKSEKALRKLQGSLKKAYTFFEEYEEHEEHKDLLENNFKKISSALQEEKGFLKKEERLLDELEKLPIVERELLNDRLVFLKIAAKRYLPVKLLIFAIFSLALIWKLIPVFYDINDESKILVSLTLIGTATITQVFNIEKK